MSTTHSSKYRNSNDARVEELGKVNLTPNTVVSLVSIWQVQASCRAVVLFYYSCFFPERTLLFGITFMYQYRRHPPVDVSLKVHYAAEIW